MKEAYVGREGEGRAERKGHILNPKYLTFDLVHFSFQPFISCHFLGDFIVSHSDGSTRYAAKKITQLTACYATEVSCKIDLNLP